MFRLLVVDDEPDITDGLYMLFHQMEETELDVYKAYSAIEALEWLEKTRIDIVVTDICMPGMNGIHLMERIRFNWPRAKIIFLTGYSEFEYVYAAIKQEGVRYILKTEGYDTIANAVKKAIAELNENLRISELSDNSEDHESYSLSVSQNNYLQSLLKGDKYDLTEIDLQCRELRIQINPHEKIIMLMARTENSFESIPEFKRLQLLNSIYRISKSHFGHLARMIFLVLEKNKLLWLLQPKLEANLEHTVIFTKGTLDTIQTQFRDSLNTSLSFIIDSEPFIIEIIRKRYESLKILLDGLTGTGVEMLLLDKRTLKSDKEMSLKGNNIPERMFFSGYGEDESISKAAISHVMDYIRDHIHEDISLVKLGELVYFNPSYLSRLFKQYTGTNLITYINKVRLDKAKELLKKSEMKIQDISEAIGFISPPYFTRFFKKETNLSPQEYRKQIFDK